MSSYVNANVMHPEPSSVGYDKEKLWRHSECKACRQKNEFTWYHLLKIIFLLIRALFILVCGVWEYLVNRRFEIEGNFTLKQWRRKCEIFNLIPHWELHFLRSFISSLNYVEGDGMREKCPCHRRAWRDVEEPRGLVEMHNMHIMGKYNVFKWFTCWWICIFSLCIFITHWKNANRGK